MQHIFIKICYAGNIKCFVVQKNVSPQLLFRRDLFSLWLTVGITWFVLPMIDCWYNQRGAAGYTPDMACLDSNSSSPLLLDPLLPPTLLLDPLLPPPPPPCVGNSSVFQGWGEGGEGGCHTLRSLYWPQTPWGAKRSRYTPLYVSYKQTYSNQNHYWGCVV